MRRTLHLHFARFAISADALDLEPLFDRLYADNDLAADARFSPAAMSFDLTVEDAASARPAAPSGVFAETNLCGGRCYYADGTFTAAVDGDYPLHIAYDVETATCRARLSRRFLDHPQAVMGRVVRPLLQSFLLPFVRLKSLHAAAVARDGRGILLAGAAGAGKTTAAIQLTREGFTLLSDDGPLVTTTAEGAVVLSSLDYLHATESTLALFPELRAHVVGGLDHRQKYAIARSALPPGDGWRAPVPIRAYVELRRHRVDRPSIVPLDRRAVFAGLVRDSMIVFRHHEFRRPRFAGYSAWTLDCLGAVAAGVRAFRLDYADHHLAELPRLLADLHA